MNLSWLLAALHLVALGIGGGAILARAFGLQRLKSSDALPGVLFADALWGIAALIWISTGLLRAFGGFEKGSAYYLQSSSFWIKMALLVGVLVLEVWPMVTLVRWRLQHGRGAEIDFRPGKRLAQISYAQAALIFCMIFAASAMARGVNM